MTSLPTDYFVCHDRLQDSNYPNKFGLWVADITSEPEEQNLDSTGEPYWLSVKMLKDFIVTSSTASVLSVCLCGTQMPGQFSWKLSKNLASVRRA